VPLPPAAQAVLDRLRDPPEQAALLLDLDGTLAPIVGRPEDARLIPGAAECLPVLRDGLGLVAFISGRGLADLERIVGVPGLAYAGNHGMEIRHAGDAARTAEAARPWLEVIAGWAGGQDGDVLGPLGLRVEDKGATLSVHWRGAPDPPAAERHLHDVLAPSAERAGLRVTWGRMVMEVRPPVAVDKGTAARELLRAAGCRRAVHIGDDRTDADAWRTLHDMRDAGELDMGCGLAAVGAEVAEEVAAAADAQVAGPEGALAALRALAAALGGRP